jgi:hypothetical protein
MSAADRMAVRMPDGEIRSVARRVGLAMIAQSRATHQRPGDAAKAATVRKPTGRPNVAQSGAHGAVTVVTADAPQLERVDVDVTPVRVVIESVAEDGSRDVVVDADTGPLVGAGVTNLPIEAPAIEQPKGNAGRAAWAEYAGIVGVPVTDEMGRNEIRDAVVAKLESDRMSQPAFAEFEGGRLATPEDEPVTESAVTHADPGERTA